MQNRDIINSMNKNGDTPLHLASKSDNMRAIRQLIDRGANKYIKNKKGKIPSEIAGNVISSNIIQQRQSPVWTLWTPNTNTWVSGEERQQIETLMLIRQYSIESTFSLIPNEVIFQIIQMFVD